MAEAQPRRWQEVLMFLCLSVFIWPFITCAFVGAYGLTFWIYFILTVPPGSH